MASETKHTPGPWQVFKSDTRFNINTPDGMHVLMTSWHSTIRNPYPLKAEAYANAVLAAAAPDLLAALREVLRCSALPDHWADGVRAAIAKATTP